MKNYLEVAFNIALDRTFHYKVPEDLREEVAIGKRVLAPFKGRKKKGFVVGTKEDLKADYVVREIEKVLDKEPVLDQNLFKLASWMAKYYLAPLGEVLFCMAPPDVVREGKQERPELLSLEEPFCNLTFHQKEALCEIKSGIKVGKFKTYLLHGVTGSGKTEVYLQAINEVRKQGKGTIVLVPEISLTPQMVERFRRRFGDEISVLHSRLSRTERFREWRRVACSCSSIVIGARSAIFAPVKNLGLIVVDEEHSSSYKQMDSPRYNARDVAVYRARSEEAVVLLGSATPSIESFHNARSLNKYTCLSLPERVDNKKLPKVKLVDMREELKRKNKGIFSLSLKQAIKEKISKKEQIILFLNRRGFATFIQCQECGYAFRCPNCEISLTYHSKEKKIRCHYCNFSKQAPSTCPSCKGASLRLAGFGTQRIERELKDLFPEMKTLRMDLDTTRKKDSHQTIFSSFSKHEADCLIGTQMITKGLDFPRVTLVGVVLADTALNLPDFRAQENTFSLLSQVAGRSGRGEKEGLVIIQSFTPENESILLACEHDYKNFYLREIVIREKLGYPPFNRLVRILIKSKNEEKLNETVSKIDEEMPALVNGLDIQALGPGPCLIYKLKREYRCQILLKGKRPSHLRHLAKSIKDNFSSSGVGLFIDVDPMGIL